MALDKPDTIDFLAIDRDGGIVLVLAAYIDDREELKTLALIQQKLNRYFDCIESGEVYERASEVAKRVVPPTTPVRIEVVANRHLRGADGPRFLQHAASACREAGIEFEFRVSPDKS